jgi:hypothetical protein
MPRHTPHEIPVDANSLTLLDWLEGKGQLSGGEIPLLCVLQKLVPEVLDPTDQSRLAQCIADVGCHFDIPDVSHLLQPNAPKTDDKPALMLEIWSKAPPGNRCNIQGWLFYSAEHNFKVYPNDQEETLNLDDEAALSRLVDDLYKILSEHNIDDNNVIVEFILPIDLLSQPVEQWSDEFDDPLGMRLPVVVRYRERLRDSTRRLGLKARWDALFTHFQKTLSHCLWWCDDSQRREVRRRLQQGACIALCTVPDVLAPRKTNLMLYLFHHGAPVIFWPRCPVDQTDLEEAFKTFAATHSIEALPTLFHNMRHTLWENENEDAPCYNLTLVWDDPTRSIPDEPESDDEYLQGPAVS